MTENTTTKDVEKKGAGLAPIAVPSAVRLAELVEVNMGGSLRVVDLTRVVIPGAGSVAWQIPLADGIASTEEITGVIVGFTRARAFWPDKLGEGEVFPTCSSGDAVTGIGLPGGSCKHCPLSRFGSRGRFTMLAGGTLVDNGPQVEDSRAQACREFRVVLVLRPGDLLPTVIRLAPSSIGELSRYATALTTEGIAFYEVLTGFRLVQDHREGLTWSRASLRRVRMLDEGEAKAAGSYAQIVRHAFDISTAMADATMDSEGNASHPGRVSVDPETGEVF